MQTADKKIGIWEERAGDTIANSLNCMTLDAEQVGYALLNQHRTLQQNFTRVAVEYFKQLLESGRYDGRNEASYKFAESIREQLKEAYFPYI
jgi:hypothetical protein